MRFSEARKRKVVSSENAETVGRVDSFVVDATRRSVIAVKLKKTDDGDTLRWGDLTAFGTDAVTVSSAGRIVAEPDDVAALSDKDHRVLGKRVLSDGGDELGEVDDVDFDPATGSVEALLLKHGSVEEVAGSRLVGIGSYAVVVRSQA